MTATESRSRACSTDLQRSSTGTSHSAREPPGANAYHWPGNDVGRSRKLRAMASGLEIFDRVVYGQTLFHRDHDAWDLIDENGLVAAVLCPRKSHLSISIPRKRVPPKPAGRRIPYGEKVAHKIGEE